jgi:hypothetical protein
MILKNMYLIEGGTNLASMLLWCTFNEKTVAAVAAATRPYEEFGIKV